MYNTLTMKKLIPLSLCVLIFTGCGQYSSSNNNSGGQLRREIFTECMSMAVAMAHSSKNPNIPLIIDACATQSLYLRNSYGKEVGE